jgi:hypothetical protein
MNMTRTLLSSIVLAAGVSGPALAALGGDVTSIEADRVYLKGAVRVTPTVDYSVHEIDTSSGVVQEYVSSSGKVFALSWRGAGIPDLRQMLGGYYGEFAQARNSAPHYNHHQMEIRTPNVVVQSSGHLRTFFGRAWVPALLPANFPLNDVR